MITTDLPQLATLAYTPFIDPIDVDAAWYLLLLPLAALTALAYKSVRAPREAMILRQSALFAVQIIVGIVGLYIAALVVFELVLPRIV